MRMLTILLIKMMRERGPPSGSFEVPLVDQMNLKCFTTRSFNTQQSARVRNPALFICRTYIWMVNGHGVYVL